MTEKRIRCSICKRRIDIELISGWTQGNNAQPINAGRCCNDCNAMFVIPERLARMIRKEPPKLKVVE